MVGDERGYDMACVKAHTYFVCDHLVYALHVAFQWLTLLAHTNARGDDCASDHMKTRDLCFRRHFDSFCICTLKDLANFMSMSKDDSIIHNQE